jgi:large subunit ribosomal protein L22
MVTRFVATSHFIPRSHFKMRPLADALVRGKRADVALNLLKTSALKKALPLEKLLKSAISNALQMGNLKDTELLVKSVCVDQGPMRRYFKPGAMGRANVQKKRFSHLKIVLEPIAKHKEV